MDFKTIAPSSITWTTWYRGQPAARLGDGIKVIVQTPVATCRVSLATQGMQRIDMALQPVTQVHADFAEWLCDVDSAAADAVTAWRHGKTQSSSLFRNSFRLTAFTNTECFDAAGKVSFDLIDAASCSCLLELQGCWSTDSRWGLRWKVVQVKFDTSVPACIAHASYAPPPTDLTPAQNPFSAFAFID